MRSERRLIVRWLALEIDSYSMKDISFFENSKTLGARVRENQGCASILAPAACCVIGYSIEFGI